MHPSEASQSGPSDRGRVLVVDDDPDLLASVGEALSGGGHAWVPARTAALALEEAARGGLSAVLLDLGLPDAPGFEVLAALRASPANRDVPVIVMTGLSGREARERARALDATDFLTKPFEREELLGRLALVTRIAWSRDELLHRWLARRLRESEERYALVFDASAEAILVVHEGRVVDANPAAVRVLGRPLGALRAETFESLSVRVPGPSDPGSQLHALAASGEPGPWVVRRADGSSVHLEASVRPVAVPGLGAAQLVTARDMTRQRTLEGALQQAQRLEGLGLLAGGIAHDFNNMLTAIMGFLELALAQRGPHQIHAGPRVQLQEARRAAERASELTRQLLAVGRRAPAATDRTVSLNDVVSRCAGLLRRVLREDICLETRLEAREGRVRGDPARLEQVLLNLATNARDAMPRGGQLLIETRDVTVGAAEAPGLGLAPGRHVLLHVSDTGLGMSDSVKTRIFEPFFTTKSPETGTGLGLSVVHAIVQDHGGRISVSSSPGQGTEFWVHLPASEGEGAVESTPGPLRRGNAQILVVEDEPVVREVTVAMLETLGYGAIPVTSAAEAFAVWSARRQEISLVISDVIMPDENGIELERRLHAVDPALKILLVSGHPRESAADSGVAWLEKPITIHELSARVAELLEAPPAPRATRGSLRPAP